MKILYTNTSQTLKIQLLDVPGELVVAVVCVSQFLSQRLEACGLHSPHLHLSKPHYYVDSIMAESMVAHGWLRTTSLYCKQFSYNPVFAFQRNSNNLRGPYVKAKPLFIESWPKKRQWSWLQSSHWITQVVQVLLDYHVRNHHFLEVRGGEIQGLSHRAWESHFGIHLMASTASCS